MGDTTIQWTDKTWNPTRGCSRVSPGCVNCYAEALAGRYSAYGAKPDSPFAGFVTKVNGHASWTGKVELMENMLDAPLHWRKPCRIFVNSMSDLFHEALHFDDISDVWWIMKRAQHHTYQILTKRAERMAALMPRLSALHGVLPCVWLGVSVEDRARKDRIDFLRGTPAAVRFLSIEPLLEDIGALDLRGISWVIVGGESGPNARRFELKWALDIKEQCRKQNVKYFMKQVGSNSDLEDWTEMRQVDRHGGDPLEWPADWRVREYPVH